jgi:hypothetical protein
LAVVLARGDEVGNFSLTPAERRDARGRDSLPAGGGYTAPQSSEFLRGVIGKPLPARPSGGVFSPCVMPGTLMVDTWGRCAAPPVISHRNVDQTTRRRIGAVSDRLRGRRRFGAGPRASTQFTTAGMMR